VLGHMISSDSEEIDVLIQLVERAMMFSALDKNTVDFTDMIWFPYHFKQWPWMYDVVIVDEAQDQNAAMLSLARKSKKRNTGRLIIVGDPHQAIYAWRGADSEFMERATDEMGAHVLTLPHNIPLWKEHCKRSPSFGSWF
jgi:superfamily I DNA/RNA helicase